MMGVKWVGELFERSVLFSSEKTSFAFGMASLVFWSVAEIPQIITNFQTKSGHGVSFVLLLTWIVGDVFNLVGCLLEPATLPTQFYTAVLYTTITVVLMLQTMYYDYAVRWPKGASIDINRQAEVQDDKNSVGPRPPLHPTAPIPLVASSRRDICYTSARSLTNSGTPTFGSYIGAWGEPAGETSELLLHAEETSPRRSSASAALMASALSPGRGTLLGVCASLPLPTKALKTALYSGEALRGMGIEGGPYGVWLGWIMASIYLGGRLPQIILNIKRGSIEGLNPVMFLLAVLANASYVGSILVESVEWRRIRANAPWLVDAAGCVLLDFFILLQFFYYKSVHGRKKADEKNGFGDYEEIKIPSP